MTESRSYFAPCLGLIPEFEEKVIDAGEFRVHRRLWQTSTFDFYTLEAHHKLHLPSQLMHMFTTRHVHMEIETRADSLDEAQERLSVYRAMLNLLGITPYLMPFLTTHSINEYSGINDRESGFRRDKLAPELREGITSKTATVEAWPHELSLTLIPLEEPGTVTELIARQASQMFKQWVELERVHPELRAVRTASEIAPRILQIGSSLLHVWIGLESLFPNVRSEVSFRIALLLAELCSYVKPATDTYKIAKRSYTHRSNAAHGNLKDIDHEAWTEAWHLLCTCMLAVVRRGELPSESALLTSMLERAKPTPVS